MHGHGVFSSGAVGPHKTVDACIAPAGIIELFQGVGHGNVVTQERGNPQSRFWLLEVDGHVVGYLKMNWGLAQTEPQEDGGIEIERIYLLKAFQGRGLGSALFDKAMDFARSSGSRFIWLGVWENNDRAMAFYTSMGFEITGTHDFRMGDVVDTDYIMRLTL